VNEAKIRHGQLISNICNLEKKMQKLFNL